MRSGSGNGDTAVLIEIAQGVGAGDSKGLGGIAGELPVVTNGDRLGGIAGRLPVVIDGRVGADRKVSIAGNDYGAYAQVQGFVSGNIGNIDVYAEVDSLPCQPALSQSDRSSIAFVVSFHTYKFFTIIRNMGETVL